MREKKKHPILRELVTGGVFWIAAVALWLAAVGRPGFAEWYVTRIYPLLVNTVGRAFSQIPFSLAEVLLYVMGVCFVIAFIKVIVRCILAIRQERAFVRILKILGRGVLSLWVNIGGLLLIFMIGCGVNYHCRSFVQREELVVEAPTAEELLYLCLLSVQEANDAAEELGLTDPMELPKDAQHVAQESMEKLGDTFPTLSGYYPVPKRLLFPPLLSVQQVTGVYSPFTIEANVNGDIPDYDLAFTYCHELAHLKGYMREEEANFIAWLACRNSESPEFRYGGALSGFVYAGNALHRLAPELYYKVREYLCPAAEADLVANREFWDRYEGKPAEVHEQVNDAYLKANSQTAGVQSYGRVVDLMIAWLRAEAASGR